jgi:hypothetical protein
MHAAENDISHNAKQSRNLSCDSNLCSSPISRKKARFLNHNLSPLGQRSWSIQRIISIMRLLYEHGREMIEIEQAIQENPLGVRSILVEAWLLCQKALPNSWRTPRYISSSRCTVSNLDITLLARFHIEMRDRFIHPSIHELSPANWGFSGNMPTVEISYERFKGHTKLDEILFDSIRNGQASLGVAQKSLLGRWNTKL